MKHAKALARKGSVHRCPPPLSYSPFHVPCAGAPPSLRMCARVYVGESVRACLLLLDLIRNSLKANIVCLVVVVHATKRAPTPESLCTAYTGQRGKEKGRYSCPRHRSVLHFSPLQTRMCAEREMACCLLACSSMCAAFCGSKRETTHERHVLSREVCRGSRTSVGEDVNDAEQHCTRKSGRKATGAFGTLLGEANEQNDAQTHASALMPACGRGCSVCAAAKRASLFIGLRLCRELLSGI